MNLIAIIGLSIISIISVVMLYGICQICIKLARDNGKIGYSMFYNDGIPPHYYITGDKHRKFELVKQFCTQMRTRRKDVLIVLGDAGFNYFEDERDKRLKSQIAAINITLFCIHGNKEKRPENIESYGVKNFCGGKVYYEPQYPNILFAIDGEIYTFDGREYLVVGGAHSVDKQKCLTKGEPFWEDELPSDRTKELVMKKLYEHNNSIYGILTHTCPLKFIPKEVFLSTLANAKHKAKKRNSLFFKWNKNNFTPDIDRSTEEWLDTIDNTVEYTEWFCGHYHIDKEIDKITMLCRGIRPLYIKK